MTTSACIVRVVLFFFPISPLQKKFLTLFYKIEKNPNCELRVDWFSILKLEPRSLEALYQDYVSTVSNYNRFELWNLEISMKSFHWKLKVHAKSQRVMLRPSTDSKIFRADPNFSVPDQKHCYRILVSDKKMISVYI